MTTCTFEIKVNIVLIDPAGSGKDTQASNIKVNICFVHLSTGDMLRDAVAAGTELGKESKGSSKLMKAFFFSALKAVASIQQRTAAITMPASLSELPNSKIH